MRRNASARTSVHALCSATLQKVLSDSAKKSRAVLTSCSFRNAVSTSSFGVAALPVLLRASAITALMGASESAPRRASAGRFVAVMRVFAAME